ncbi:phosphatidylinositol kinase [Salinibacterium xinjiangense]|uniref:Serine/threonine-protein kinase HipA n=1 Tax=Salinibacterium xinjiangense TaxID=386302 RepID=A0A2C8ZVV4_9MICO|nr:HipA domain-containing protein [Salinibacterium xinjiangense]GGL02955.1 phosphatidylinositol kinase [Salinibacterium xinjiangense]SOE69839.1 serine/threonine-protein kinase HipA [Salinibacterium xinjiangense]
MADHAYVWIWLPNKTEPVVAGRVQQHPSSARQASYSFIYGRSYLANPDALPLFTELPLSSGEQLPTPGLDIAGVLLDATPDSWGRRVVNEQVLSSHTSQSEPAELDLLTYMLRSGSNRIGALDFQPSATEYIERGSDHQPTVGELMDAAELIERGEVISPGLADALFLASSVGGARPKAALVNERKSLIAKFPSSTDQYPMVKYEALAMDLARRVGIRTAGTELLHTAGRDVLLVERFDRPGDGTRRMQVSALTVLGVNPDTARSATSYPALADKIRSSFTDSKATLRELFERIVFNVIIRNTDDHARNTAAFWDGTALTLTPAYDITPSHGRRDSVASHPMAITADGDNRSLLAVCISAAAVFQLSEPEAQAIVDHQVEIVQTQWRDAADKAQLTARERDALWEKSILNPAIFWDK